MNQLEFSQLWVSLHTGAPMGLQTDQECRYVGYKRQRMPEFKCTAPRMEGGVLLSPLVVVGDIIFPVCNGGSEFISHFALGTSERGPGVTVHSGVVTPTIPMMRDITPRMVNIRIETQLDDAPGFETASDSNPIAGGAWIQRFRRQHNMSQETMASRLRVSVLTVSIWEKSPAEPGHLVRLAMAALEKKLPPWSPK